MGRSKSRKRTRDNTSIARRSLRFEDFIYSPSPSIALPSNSFSSPNDRRTWHPDDIFRPAPSPTRSQHTLTVGPTVATPSRVPASRSLTVPQSHAVYFDDPATFVCARRRTRKEVMHATRKAGRGGQKRPRRNWLSDVSCKRKK